MQKNGCGQGHCAYYCTDSRAHESGGRESEGMLKLCLLVHKKSYTKINTSFDVMKRILDNKLLCKHAVEGRAHWGGREENNRQLIPIVNNIEENNS